MDEKIIELMNINLERGNAHILENINLVIERGQFLGVIGPNGAGKTTLLKIILGLIRPTSGTIKLFGRDIHNFKDWYRIGYIPQHALSFDANFPISVFEVVSMGRFSKKGLFKKLGKDDMQAIDEALEIVDMGEYRNRMIGELSGGQQQRVFIARALSSQPELLILDEPTVGVDIVVQREFYDFLEILHKEKKITLVLSTHDISNIASRVGKLACINRRLFPECHPEEFFTGIPAGDMRFVHHLHRE
ncbi:ATPase component of Mn/Zn ABC-type transporter [Candidatus Methanoperedens nitroreducens]|uniref:Cobalamin import ATP-binding protein BtuD n=1 Tax=Candidatus Methanoperedens nitratireducens TaxID=1392998 RepID=A0A062V9D2_9EURY|nr:metal ABC transporter ATP-binding protein [Candidatus Methanoperedens nitroreducens]KCZ73163.1 ATPase component of Mn/Zn ABC-type transporter [Candidatus Methanoperedens nitroreducens]MDJ1422888.1 metal ABC transporter ATP-binding protein [Candidatus Methanoperedens sp.]